MATESIPKRVHRELMLLVVGCTLTPGEPRCTGALEWSISSLKENQMTCHANQLKSPPAGVRRTWMARASSIIGALFLFVALSSATQAQVTGGTISGTVTDEPSAPVAGATITILNRAKGETRTPTTSDTRFFTVP